MESDGHADLPEQRVQRRLAQLGADTASAPAVPGGVTARVVAALRVAPSPPAHAITRPRRRLSRLQIIGLVIGGGAATAVIAIGAMALRHDAAPTRTYPAGPTAERITVSAPSAPGDTPKAVVTRP